MTIMNNDMLLSFNLDLGLVYILQNCLVEISTSSKLCFCQGEGSFFHYLAHDLLGIDDLLEDAPELQLKSISLLLKQPMAS